MHRSEAEFGRLRHYIWDFDGTLFDTYPVMIRCLRAGLSAFGKDADPVEIMERMLNNVAYAIDSYVEEFNIPLTGVCQVYDRCRQQAEEELASKPMENAAEVLQMLKNAGGHHYIFTHRAQANTEAYLQKYGLLEFFENVLGPDSPGFAMKPAPDAILYLMKKHQMDPEETVMIGDRFIDLESGRRAGIRTAHLICALAPQELECHWRFESFDHMRKVCPCVENAPAR